MSKICENNNLWNALLWIETGVKHRKHRELCQDVGLYLRKGGVYCYALSDGAGSCSYALEAAELSTRVAAKWLLKNFHYLKRKRRSQVWIQSHLFERLYKRIHRASRYRSGTPQMQDWGCTLLVLVHDGEDYIAAHIGDGVIACRSIKDAVIRPISMPDNGETSTITYFLTSRGAKNHLRVYSGKLYDIESLVLMTDGVSDTMWQSESRTFTSALGKFLDWVSNDNSSSEVWLDIQANILSVIQQYSVDDCGLIIAQRQNNN